MDLPEPSAKKCKASPTKKTFQHQWYDDFAQWTTWVKEFPPDPTKYDCLICNQRFACGRTEIDRHANTDSHLKNSRLSNLSADLSSFAGSSPIELDFNDRVKAAEIRFVKFIAEKNIPLSIAPEILHLFQLIGKEPAVLQKMTAGQTKVTGVINRVVSVHQSHQVVEV